MTKVQLIYDYAFLWAALVGLVASLAFSGANQSKTWDEWLCNLIAAEVGVMAVTGILYGVAESQKIPEILVYGLCVYAGLSIVGALLARLLDLADHYAASVFSLLLKWTQSPLTTTVGLLASIVVAIANDVSFRRGVVLLNIGSSSQAAITLGGVVWAKGGCFESSGRAKDDLAQHEAFHSRQVMAFHEIGFYLTYLIVGMSWGHVQGAAMSMTSGGCGNPFEKTARTYNHSETPKGAHECPQSST